MSLNTIKISQSIHFIDLVDYTVRLNASLSKYNSLEVSPHDLTSCKRTMVLDSVLLSKFSQDSAGRDMI